MSFIPLYVLAGVVLFISAVGVGLTLYARRLPPDPPRSRGSGHS